MRLTHLSLIVITFFGATALLRGEETATTKPTTAPSTRPSGGGSGRLFAPYSKLTDLTDDQKDKIREIHRKALDDVHEITAKEMDEINALLTDDQKQELHQVEDKTAADRKSKTKGSGTDQTKQ